mmetsp:Transcript_18069/g.27942  ORF Transcript_18069/g.27942 Transcript_18069/m.27942 type:complete len:393 (+) Transcript_18069:58-1236(+)
MDKEVNSCATRKQSNANRNIFVIKSAQARGTKEKKNYGKAEKNTFFPIKGSMTGHSKIILFIAVVVVGIILASKQNGLRDIQKAKSRSPKNNDKKGIITNRTSFTSLTKIAWLMSFPNSGTSYTLRMVRSLSKKPIGTNYKKEGTAEPVYDDSPNGPFFLRTKPDDPVNMPNFLLTKTHCAGINSHCKTAITTPQSFLKGCCTAVEAYDAALVHKAVHLFRDPFDNMVSRFHLYLKQLQKQADNSTEDVKMYSKSEQGFREYCDAVKSKFHSNSNVPGLTDPAILDSFKSVPCYFDLFLYVQWHNNAFETIAELDLPTHKIHYESYDSHYNKTVNGLFDFLELTPGGVECEFTRGKKYSEYFTLKEKRATKRALRKLSSKQTWESIQHYFEF